MMKKYKLLGLILLEILLLIVTYIIGLPYIFTNCSFIVSVIYLLAIMVMNIALLTKISVDFYKKIRSSKNEHNC
jgi:hypothetical protein